jgi:lipopolysaccharide transport system ATP-binding protein
MDDIAIRVEGLGKRFRLRHAGSRPRYRTLREDLLGLPRRLLAGFSGHRDEREEFWALKDVSFEVKRGEVLGIIGRNGAGKSTLLKILSRIMDPTCGEAIVQGRIGSLLEVGTGFHPELTGRENIFLSGALLGMRRDEVRRRFDEIVAFAGVEKFLDTPCKHYSSGMYARLGFAVAAHLDAEILLVDEVLAVGDAEFQRKCIGKMTEVAGGGRVVMFVSHNMAAVSRLCTNAMVLDNGCGRWWGSDVKGAINDHLSEGSTFTEWNEDENVVYKGHHWFSLERMRLVDAACQKLLGAISGDTKAFLEITCIVYHIHPALCIGFAIYSDEGTPLFWSYQTDVEDMKRPRLVMGRQTLRVNIPTEVLNEGCYRIDFLAGLHGLEWIVAPQSRGPSVTLDIGRVAGGSSFRLLRRPVLLAPVLDWEIEKSTVDSDPV